MSTRLIIAELSTGKDDICKSTECRHRVDTVNLLDGRIRLLGLGSQI
jgi:hypothetical protein